MFVAAYPKSGSTWLRFLIYQLATGRGGDFAAINAAIPGIGHHLQTGALYHDVRLIKTHEPHRPEYQRAIYMVRDGRDVLISEYHYQKWARLVDPMLPFERFFEMFITGSANRYGSWAQHIRSWLEAKQRGDVELHLVRFEDLKSAPEDALARIGRFLGIEHLATDDLKAILENNSVSNMRAKEVIARETLFKHTKGNSRFVRSGKAGGWRDQLSGKQAARFVETAGDALAGLGYPLQ